MPQMFKLMIFLNVESKKEWDKLARKREKAHQWDEWYKWVRKSACWLFEDNTEFIHLFETETFLSRFTKIFNLIYFPLKIVKKIVIIVSTLGIICA
jgi:hypothetical protein